MPGTVLGAGDPNAIMSSAFKELVVSCRASGELLRGAPYEHELEFGRCLGWDILEK